MHERFVHDRLVFQGAVPFLVSCTCGTTVRGAFDPLDLIADVCEKHKLWMHVDVSHPLKDEYVHMCVEFKNTQSPVLLFVSGGLGRERALFQATRTSDERG